MTHPSPGFSIGREFTVRLAEALDRAFPGVALDDIPELDLSRIEFTVMDRMNAEIAFEMWQLGAMAARRALEK